LRRINEIKLEKLLRGERRKLLINFSNYGVFQVVNYLIPVITIPYIVRVIGVEKFGILSLAQAVCYYFRIIVEYGFTITGVQLIAQNQGNPEKKGEIFSAILFIQVILMLIGFGIILIATLFISDIHQYFWVYLFSYLAVPANLLLLLWFYIGSEEMRYLNYINLISRITYIILIFGFIRTAKDYIFIPLITDGSLLFAGIFSLLFVLKKFDLKPRWVGWKKIKFYLIDGWPLFISNFATNLYRNSNIIILGILANKEVVGIYSAGEKLIKVFQSIFAPITQTFFPYISRLKTEKSNNSLRTIKKLLLNMGLVGGFISIILFIAAKPITIVFLGKQFLPSVTVMRIASSVVLFGVLNYILGIIFMSNFNLKKEFSFCVILTGLLSIGICFVLSYYLQYTGAAIAFASSEIILFLLILYFIYKNRSRWTTA